MRSWIAITLYVYNFVFVFIQLTHAERDQVYMPAFPEENIAKCEFEVGNSCLQCQESCPSISESYLKKRVPEYRKEVRDFAICRSRISFVTRGLPEWCINDEEGFYHTNKFEPTREVCMNITNTGRCISFLSAYYGQLPATKELVRGIYYLYLALEKRDTAETKLVSASQFKSLLEKSYEQRWLEEIREYANNLENVKSRFYDPVFYNYTEWSQDYYKLDRKINKMDLHSLNIERLFVEQATIKKIPSIITDIKNLKNEISSHKDETDKVLDEIKSMTDKIFAAQLNATNVIYETTHSKDLDGEIRLLDEELLDRYINLKVERGKLRTETVKSTFSKLQMIAVIRKLIKKISTTQQNFGCRKGEVIGIEG